MLLLPALLAASRGAAQDAFDAGPAPLLVRHPTMNATTIVFGFAGELWSVPRAGGEARQLTNGADVDEEPYFSPDGTQIAFSADYDGNTDVYVMPAEGGVPRRLTAHPDPDVAVGWSPDGKSVLFTSSMLSATDLPRLFTVPVSGGFPTALPLPSGSMASYSPDGSHLAYVPGIKWETAWKRYRGGQTYPIWVADLSDSKVKEIPRRNTNDDEPMWVGDRIFYLSDPRGPVGLYSYDVKSGKETEEIAGAGFDIRSATAGPGGIVYEKLGGIDIYDPETRTSRKVPISIHGDFLQVRPEFKSLTPYLESASISPSGSRVAVCGRGWIATAPASKGDVRLLDQAQGVHRRDPAWSPDGKSVAYISDAKGDQQLAVKDLAAGTTALHPLGDSPAYYHAPTWAPDGTKLSYYDNRNELWILDLKTGANAKVDATLYDNPRRPPFAQWSPDSKWLAYARDLPNHFGAIFLFDVATGVKTQITDGLADADSPVFDRGGKYLYFTASTDVGQSSSWLDLSSLNQQHPTSSVYAVVLRKDTPDPLHPESDEEEGKAPAAETPKPAPGAKAPAPIAPAEKPLVELDGIESRIIALPVAPAEIAGLVAGPAESVFVVAVEPGARAANVVKFSFATRTAAPFFAGVSGIQVTPDGSKALLSRGPMLAIASTAAPGPGTPVNLTGFVAKIDPRKEWASMYHEVWRNERILLYSPTMNGIDSVAMEKRYEPFLENLCSRQDLNYLFDDMLGELCVGHEFPGGGDVPSGRAIRGGLLGADYEFKDGKYRFARIYDGERWNPGLYAPLAQPGVDAKVGDYLLAIDGRDLSSSTDVYEALEGKAGMQVKLRIGPSPDGKGSHEAIVVPVANEFGLRQRAWEEDNRRYVLKMTGGRGAYVHVPDTEQGGWDAFNRYYYAQVGLDGAVIDERFNHGGLINDFMIHEMTKKLDAMFHPRYGKDWPTPGSAIYGPKVMLINQWAGSGGDCFPWLFRHENVGPLIGKRTWGGLIAAFGFSLVDGGRINAPDDAFYNPWTGKWDVENWGVDPDQDVELDPYEWRQGHDSQLDAAIAELNKRLATYKAPDFQHPPFPDRTKLNVRY